MPMVILTDEEVEIVLNRSTKEDKIESNKVIDTIFQLAGDLGGGGVDVVDLRMNSIKIGDYLVDDPNPNIFQSVDHEEFNSHLRGKIMDIQSLCVAAGFTVHPYKGGYWDKDCLSVETKSSTVHYFIANLLFYAQKNNISTTAIAYALRDLNTVKTQDLSVIAFFPNTEFAHAHTPGDV